MTEQGAKIMENFADFLYSPTPGGSTDLYADTQKVLIQKKLDETSNTDLVSKTLEDSITESKKIGEEIQGMIHDFQTTSGENKKGSLIRNRFPYGETVIYPEDDETKDILGSILDTNLDQLTASSIAFARLCKTLLPKDYKEVDTEILMDIFGSIADYPIIDKKSNGMMSIGHLFVLFNEFYMNYNTRKAGSNKEFIVDGKGIDKQQFFDRFLQISSLQLDRKQTFDDKNFKSSIGDVNVFNPDFWYADFNLEEFEKAFKASGMDYLADSYGAFFRAPALSNIKVGTGTTTLGDEVNTFDDYGSYLRRESTLFSNKSKVFCLLFQKQRSITSSDEEILKGYSYPVASQNTITPNQIVLKYLYNSNNQTGIHNIRSDSGITFSRFQLPVSNLYFQAAVINKETFMQSAGGKKKLKGGTYQNLFDQTSTPNIQANRTPKKFNPIIFEKSIRRFQRENDKYNLDDIENKIKTSYYLPIFYHDIKQKLGNISYEELRYLFHWSSIYTTYKKLLIHFFTNIAACYNFYSTVIVEKQLKNSKNINKQVLLKMQDNIAKLISHIQKIIQKLNTNLIEPGKQINLRDLFVGFNIMNQGQEIGNIVEDEYFKKYFLLAISPNDFKTFIQLFSLKHNIAFGGIPITLSTEAFNKNISECFRFFLRYRFLANKNFIELLEIYKTQNKQMVPTKKFEEISERVKEKFKQIKEQANSMPKNSMEEYRVIIMQTIAFGIKAYITILRDIFTNLSSPSKSTSRIGTTKKNSIIDTYENMRKVGEFKQTIYKFIHQLKDAGYDQNLYLFLYGQLFQFIYIIDELINDNKSMTPEDFKAKFVSLGIDINMSDYDIQQKSRKIMEILTDREKSLRLKERFFGLFAPKETLINNAKRLLTTSYDPKALTSNWWVDIERQYLKVSGNRKLFVIALEPVVNAGKFSKTNIWLIDLFATVQSSTKPIIRNMGIKTIEQVGPNGVVIKEYYGDNNLIMLNPWIRTMREFKGDFQKWFTKDTVWWKDPSGWKRKVRNLFKNKSKKLQSSETGRLFAEYLGIRRQEKDEDGGFKNSEIMTRLIQGKLDSYVQTNSSEKVLPSILMGYNENQLRSILKTHLEAESKGHRFAKNARSYDDWQLYLIQGKDYASTNAFRMWAFNLLMSKPWVFNERIMMDKNAVPLSNFSKIQVPFKNYFVKVGDFGVSSVLLEFYKLITGELFRNSRNLSTIKDKKNFIPQTVLSELELPRNRGDFKINNGAAKKFTKIMNNESSSSGVFLNSSGASRAVSTSAIFSPTSSSVESRSFVGSSASLFGNLMGSDPTSSLRRGPIPGLDASVPRPLDAGVRAARGNNTFGRAHFAIMAKIRVTPFYINFLSNLRTRENLFLPYRLLFESPGVLIIAYYSPIFSIFYNDNTNSFWFKDAELNKDQSFEINIGNNPANAVITLVPRGENVTYSFNSSTVIQKYFSHNRLTFQLDENNGFKWVQIS